MGSAPRRWWRGEEANCGAAESRMGGGAVGAIQSSTKGVVFFFLVLLVLVAVISRRWMDDSTFSMISSWREQTPRLQHSHQPQPKPVTLTCPNHTTTPLHYCRRTITPSPSSSPSAPATSGTEPPPSCPDYFRWIHEDLRPWNSTGITRKMVESARQFAAFRLLVIGGRVYVDQYHRVFQTRDLFTLWGFVQLANRYPGRLPDLDLMFNCEDMPTVKADDYNTSLPPPPLFRYCKDDSTVDIVFPDWSFWGWPEINVKPWEVLREEMKEANDRMAWEKRKPYAFWKGNPTVSGHRKDLMRCNSSNGHDWNARVYAQVQDLRRGEGVVGELEVHPGLRLTGAVRDDSLPRLHDEGADARTPLLAHKRRQPVQVDQVCSGLGQQTPREGASHGEGREQLHLGGSENGVRVPVHVAPTNRVRQAVAVRADVTGERHRALLGIRGLWRGRACEGVPDGGNGEVDQRFRAMRVASSLQCGGVGAASIKEG
ncbi:uncharacterized protein LOC103980687 isoform X2 [Musa acuminata AAA Group]|uniref:uncharacterized protein LOC103980687 isoform X2 n=1 Tax=Musa acuminata AAA Group TaxID=214697 RepID=UPI0031D3D96B